MRSAIEHKRRRRGCGRGQRRCGRLSRVAGLLLLACLVAGLARAAPTDDPVATRAAVERLVDRGELGQARRLAEAEARREGGDALLLLRVAIALQEKDALEEALGAAELVLTLRPGDAQAQSMIYELHRRHGTLGKYEQVLVAAAAQPAGAATALRRLADFYTRERKADEALVALERLARLEPRDPETHALAGRIALQAGRTDRAVACFRQALTLRPGDRRLLSELAESYARAGERDQAIATWKQSLDFDPADMNSVRALGTTLHAAGFHQDAIDLYLAARLRRESATAFAPELGEAYEALLFIDKAVSEYLLALAGPIGGARQAEMRLRLLADDEAARPDLIAALERERAARSLADGALIALGLAYLEAGQATRGEACFAAIGDATRRGQALVQTAAGLEQAGDGPIAAALYELALGATLPATLRAEVGLRLCGLYLAAEEWPRARDVLVRLSAEPLPGPLAVAIRLTLADILVLQAGDWQAAGELYSQVLVAPQSGEDQRHARWGMADCAFVAGRLAEAAQAYRDLLKQETEAPPVPPMPLGGGRTSPTWALSAEAAVPARPMGPQWGALRLAEIEFRSGQFKQATADFQRLAAEHPAGPYANDALARVLVITTRFTGESPAEPKVLAGLILLDQGDLAGSARALRQVMSLGPDEPLADLATMLYADGLARFGDPSQAATEYEKLAAAFARSPLAPEALLEAARLRARQPEQREAALKLFRELQTRFPHSPEAAEAEIGIDDLLRHATR